MSLVQSKVGVDRQRIGEAVQTLRRRAADIAHLHSAIEAAYDHGQRLQHPDEELLPLVWEIDSGSTLVVRVTPEWLQVALREMVDSAIDEMDSALSSLRTTKYLRESEQ